MIYHSLVNMICVSRQLHESVLQECSHMPLVSAQIEVLLEWKQCGCPCRCTTSLFGRLEWLAVTQNSQYYEYHGEWYWYQWYQHTFSVTISGNVEWTLPHSWRWWLSSAFNWQSVWIDVSPSRAFGEAAPRMFYSTHTLIYVFLYFYRECLLELHLTSHLQKRKKFVQVTRISVDNTRVIKVVETELYSTSNTRWSIKQSQDFNA